VSGVLLAALLAALPAAAKPRESPDLRQNALASAKPEFEKLAAASDGFPYKPVLTPFFPTAWPPKGGLLVAYAYAYRHDPGLSDGVEVAPLWAELKVDPRSPRRVRVTRLADALSDAATQGVRPLEQAEIDILKTEADFAGHSSIPKGAAAERMRAYFCAWRGTNGVAAGMVEPRQKAFFAWLACDDAPAP
jgi:hypothetical protein